MPWTAVVAVLIPRRISFKPHLPRLGFDRIGAMLLTCARKQSDRAAGIVPALVSGGTRRIVRTITPLVIVIAVYPASCNYARQSTEIPISLYSLTASFAIIDGGVSAGCNSCEVTERNRQRCHNTIGLYLESHLKLLHKLDLKDVTGNTKTADRHRTKTPV